MVKYLKRIDFWMCIIGSVLFIIGLSIDNKALNTIAVILLIIGLTIIFFRKEFKSSNTFGTITNSLSIGIFHKKEGKTIFFKVELNKLINEEQSIFKSEYDYYENNCCPNCGCLLENKISSNKTCPDCKKMIVLRTSKLTKRKMLLTTEKYDIFNKLEEKRKEIAFCEKQMQSLNLVYPKYIYKFYQLKKDNDPRNTARDYTFTFQNWLACELDRETYHKYMKGLKKKFHDMVLECDEAAWSFKTIGETVIRRQIELTKFKGRDDIVLDMIINLLYRKVVSALLPYSHWEDRPFDKDFILSSINSATMYLVVDYMNEHSMTIDDIKREFFKHEHHAFIFNSITNEIAWPFIADAYHEYIKIVK